MKIWRQLPAISAPMPFQMALDEVLFRNMEALEVAAPPILRFFYSSEPWLTAGYFEKEQEMPQGVRACRRLTGGGRVEHGNDVIFSIIASKQDDSSFGSVKASYHKIHEAVKGALESLGHKITFYSADGDGSELPRGAECFVFPIDSDLAMEGKKIAGGSQKRSSGVLLHHESIQLRKGMEAASLVQALGSAFEKYFEMRLRDENLSLEDLSLARKLSQGGYQPGNYRVHQTLLEKRP